MHARDRSNLEIRWLLNVAYMTLGRYPSGVPPDVLIPADRFQSDAPQARFDDVALSSGIDIRTRAGGTLIEEDGLSHAEVVNRLAAEGHAVSKVSVGRIYRRYRDLRAMIAATTENAAARTEPSHRHEDASASAA